MEIKVFTHFRKKPKKVGVALSGGFLGGAFQVGAYKAIEDSGITIDYIVGSSVGAANAAMIASRDGKTDELISIWQNLKRKKIFTFKRTAFLKGILLSDSLCDNGPFRSLVKEYADQERFISSRIQCDIVVTNLDTGKEEVFSNRNEKDIKNPEKLVKAVMASSAIPFAFPGEKIDGYCYYDGGILDLVPVEHALSNNCDIIFVILAEPITYKLEPKGIYKTFPSLLSRLSKIYSLRQPWRDLLDAYNEKTSPQVIVIEPNDQFFASGMLPIRSIDFKRIPRHILLGYTITKRKIEDLKKKKILNI